METLFGVSTDTTILRNFIDKHLPTYFEQVHCVTVVIKEESSYKVEIVLKKGSENLHECDAFGVLFRVGNLINLCGYDGTACRVQVVRMV